MSCPTRSLTVDSNRYPRPCNLVSTLSFLHVAVCTISALPIMAMRNAFNVYNNKF